jgi:hypothetical protein
VSPIPHSTPHVTVGHVIPPRRQEGVLLRFHLQPLLYVYVLVGVGTATLLAWFAGDSPAVPPPADPAPGSGRKRSPAAWWWWALAAAAVAAQVNLAAAAPLQLRFCCCCESSARYSSGSCGMKTYFGLLQDAMLLWQLHAEGATIPLELSPSLGQRVRPT